MCQHLVDPAAKGRWLVWPAISTCCWCCTDSFGCGVLRPDWVAAVNGTYEGRAPLKTPWRGFSAADKWSAVGGQQNYYWQDGSGASPAPLMLQQGTDDYQWFDPSTFRPGPQADALFAVPKCALGGGAGEGRGGWMGVVVRRGAPWWWVGRRLSGAVISLHPRT